MSAVIIATSAATSSAAIASMNSARIEREKTSQCVLFVEGFDSRNSSVSEQKHYASCIQRLNPEPMSESGVTTSKICVVGIILAMVVGMIYGWKEDGFLGSVFFGIAFPLFLVFAAGVLLLTSIGVMFVIK